MNRMREIGRHLKAEQNLTTDDIQWLVIIAQAILRAFDWDEGEPIRTLADALGVSPTTLYTIAPGSPGPDAGAPGQAVG